MIQPKSQTLYKHQQTVQICQVPLSGSMPLHATLCHSMPLYATLTTQSQVAKIFSIASPRRSFASPQSRSTEDFTPNHEWQSKILGYPSFKGAQSEIILHWISWTRLNKNDETAERFLLPAKGALPLSQRHCGIAIFRGSHNGFVQGVSCSPLGLNASV